MLFVVVCVYLVDRGLLLCVVEVVVVGCGRCCCLLLLVGPDACYLLVFVVVGCRACFRLFVKCWCPLLLLCVIIGIVIVCSFCWCCYLLRVVASSLLSSVKAVGAVCSCGYCLLFIVCCCGGAAFVNGCRLFVAVVCYLLVLFDLCCGLLVVFVCCCGLLYAPFVFC